MAVATAGPSLIPFKRDSGDGAPVWSWLPRELIEEGAAEQIANIAHLPSAVHVAVMPDVHKGYGMPIGCALATERTVVPYAVGVDIGCGMIAQNLNIPAADFPVRDVLEAILSRVPVGQPSKERGAQAGSFSTPQKSGVLAEWIALPSSAAIGGAGICDKADRQLGTLGGGNHFIELQADEKDNVWFMLHTGSRSFGKEVCEYWHRKAVEWCDRYFVALPDKDLAFLSAETEDGQGYLRDMGFAMRFAEENRRRIYKQCIEAVRDALGISVFSFGSSWLTDYVETHHNFAAVERHMGKQVVVHRKGAVRTSHGSHGIEVTIPGSMQTGSYIGMGSPNPRALNTCSHGAGRRLGRKEAMRQFVGRNIRAEMSAGGQVLVTPEGAEVLDEAGDVYKNIEDVMAYQADLVGPLVKLRPLGTVKG